jgi:hypothetical protein
MCSIILILDISTPRCPTFSLASPPRCSIRASGLRVLSTIRAAPGASNFPSSWRFRNDRPPPGYPPTSSRHSSLADSSATRDSVGQDNEIGTEEVPRKRTPVTWSRLTSPAGLTDNQTFQVEAGSPTGSTSVWRPFRTPLSSSVPLKLRFLVVARFA